jgi:protein involved in ribonucleotide reduction
MRIRLSTLEKKFFNEPYCLKVEVHGTLEDCKKVQNLVNDIVNK